MNNQDWDDAGGAICPVCRKEVMQLFPYGFAQKRKACKECIQRRIRLLDYKRRLFESRRRVEIERRKALGVIS